MAAAHEDWSGFAGRVIARQYERGDVRVVWHPDPPGELLHHENGSIVVLTGAPKARLSDGTDIDP